MQPDFCHLTSFIKINPELKLLISNILTSNDNFWIVGGCLRNSLLHLPQVDIDLACSGDPTSLAQSWSKEISGHWFWLDSKRQQSRVLLQSGLTLDFAPLRSTTIIKDLYLRDFTVNALALPVDESFPDCQYLDPLNGIKHLEEKRLYCCSPQSFTDDPLRMLKGIRHAVTLDFELSEETLKRMYYSRELLENSAGERIRDELGKIFNSANAVKGVDLLISTGIFDVLFGSGGGNWDGHAAIEKIGDLNEKIDAIGLTDIETLLMIKKNGTFSLRAIFLFSLLVKIYNPENLDELLQKRLRLSRRQKLLIVALQTELGVETVSLLEMIEGQRRQALLAEQLGPFYLEKILFWGVCQNHVTLDRLIEVQKSFLKEQHLEHVPALLNGRRISSLSGCQLGPKIGAWQNKLKLAEIKGEITTISEAEKWLKNKLSFDKKEA
ncbi:hypothetical protein [uncultured Desulfuromusa sp.]|uniref:hypothetical protein n=1 Tax=uncultured Desulfuromusa sp. TaxID=219183 RepID=UPI002AA84B32|nr:hypothetical protein [uncultured Desulfuromusa sp.]